jgi:hypothetical protein
MMNRNLARRLERLEARLLPATEERVLRLNLVSADGEIEVISVLNLRYTVSGEADLWPRSCNGSGRRELRS